MLKNSTFIMVAAVFFSKVVLFYALWYTPLICILLVLLRKRTSVLLFVPFLILQVAMIAGGYIYFISSNEQIAFITAYLYLATSGILLAWILYDRLVSAKNGKFADRFETYKRKPRV